MSARNPLPILAAALALAAVAGCAPRIQQTHYERWATQDAQRRAERAAEEAKEKGLAAPAPAAAPAQARPAQPPPPPGETWTGAQTPPVRTATPSRAIRPADEEDDAIY